MQSDSQLLGSVEQYDRAIIQVWEEQRLNKPLTKSLSSILSEKSQMVHTCVALLSYFIYLIFPG